MHIPVLYEAALAQLQPQPGGHYIDGTLGAGGHAEGILLASAPDGRVLVFDKDPEAIAFARKRLESYGRRAIFINESFSNMGKVARAQNFGEVKGVLLDLGLSSRQLADGERGFSFLRPGPLDMRFDPSSQQTAANLVNDLDESDLAAIFWRYGEVRQSRMLARLIVENRPIESTTALAELIKNRVGQRGRIHPATQVFQALRIAVNNELDDLASGIGEALDILEPGGRLVVISFHSLEDRLVKHTFRDLSKDCICPPQQPVCTCDAKAKVRLIGRKAIKASAEEIERNPRSRSARLRVAEKLAAGPIG
jgi:16S rRNA (cytosine1402-N4)-methyltransferase